MRTKVIVRNPNGLHMRPAMILARIASRFRASATIRKQDRSANARSLVGLMTLAAESGTELDLEVSGEDSEAALAALSAALSAVSLDNMEAAAGGSGPP